jgi:CheY-like chemotaxis protein
MPERRVLLVGGDHPVVAVCSEYLRLRLGGSYEVESIEYCDDALMVLRQQPFDLILVLSLGAPWRTWPSLSSPARLTSMASAIVFLQQIRAANIQVPVIVASTRAEAKSEALASGAFDFIVKPFKLAELDEALRNACTSG